MSKLFLLAKKPQKKIGQGGGGSQMPMFHNTEMCHCIYQVLHNKIKHLKIKRKRKHKGKPKSFSNGLLVSSPYIALFLSAQLDVRGSLKKSQLASPELSGPTQQETRASSQFQPGEWSSAPLQLFFLLLPSALSLLWTPGKPLFMVSQLSLCFASILCLDFNHSLLPSDKCLLWVSCWSNSLSNQIKSLKHKFQNFLPTAPSYS